MEIKFEEQEPNLPQIHYLKNEKVLQVIKKNWGLADEQVAEATLPAPSENPTDLEKWENDQRQQRTRLLAAGLEYGDEDVALRSLQQLLYEECFGINTHPELQDSSWWNKGSSAPTPGGELSHSYPMMRTSGVGIEDCVNMDFSGNTFREQVTSIKDGRDRGNFIDMAGHLVYPGHDYLSDSKRRSLDRRLADPNKSLPEEMDTVAARFMNLCKSEKLTGPVVDESILKILGYSPEKQYSKMFVWRQLWNYFGKAIVGQDGLYRDPSDPAVKKAIGDLLTVRLSADFQGLFKHLSLEGYRQ